ncbi:N-acyl-D-amino-acid deacylase family protein [Azospirillum sp. sgz301742]
MHDLLIRNATLIDGTGAPGRAGDLAVRDGAIAAMGALDPRDAVRVIDAGRLALSPGFIDSHGHDDRALLADGMEARLSQGVTTVVVGNCGVSLAPIMAEGAAPEPLILVARDGADLFASFAAYFAALESRGLALNALSLVGHTTLRCAVMERLDRPATAAETARMAELLDHALADGAVGLSTGLAYDAARAAPVEEVTALAAVVHRHGGHYATHLRDEGDHVLPAVAEALAIGQAAGVPVLLSHHKVMGAANHGRTAETLAIIEQAARRQPVGLDAYPYAASSTTLDARRAERGGAVQITWSDPHPEAAGRDLDAIAADWGCDRATAVERLLPAGAVYFAMDEEDVRRVLAYPRTMIASDGIAGDTRPHPRLWGTFPRVLGHYVREVGLMALEEAVFRMTGLPARHWGLAGRGRLAVGERADLVLFDPASIADRATFDDPVQPAEGIAAVWVEGECVWRDGRPTGARPGRVIRLRDLKPANLPREEDAARCSCS